MGQSDFRQAVREISAEVTEALSQVDASQVHRLEEALATARAIFLTGEGRSGFIARCFAMRLMHLGLCVYLVGETITPAARKGDLLIAISRSGETRVTVAQAEAARALGMQVVAVTASPQSPLMGRSDLQLLISSPSIQYGGSLFEQTALITLDALALLLQRRLGQTAADMEARHADRA